MARRIRNINARLQQIGRRSTEVQLQEIREVLVDLYWLASRFKTRQTGDYNITGEVRYESVTMANTSAATVTMVDFPEDQAQVSVKRTDAQVTIDFNGKTYGPTGASTLIINTVGDCPTLEFDEDDNEWWPI